MIMPIRQELVAGECGRLIAAAQFGAMASGALFGIGSFATVGLFLRVDTVPYRARCLSDRGGRDDQDDEYNRF